MATKYQVTAECKNDRCKTREFQVERKKMTYMGTDGHEHVIQKLVCPDCRQHADITKIKSVETGKKVA